MNILSYYLIGILFANDNMFFTKMKAFSNLSKSPGKNSAADLTPGFFENLRFLLLFSIEVLTCLPVHTAHRQAPGLLTNFF